MTKEEILGFLTTRYNLRNTLMAEGNAARKLAYANPGNGRLMSIWKDAQARVWANENCIDELLEALKALEPSEGSDE